MPHAGHDTELEEIFQKFLDFNPHAPCGAWRQLNWLQWRWTHISIHMPHAGHDMADELYSKYGIISIHMPHAGHDDRSIFLL